MGIKERIAQNTGSAPVAPATPAPATNGQVDQYWKSVKGSGMLVSERPDVREAMWHDLALETWGCLAQNIVGLIPTLGDELEMLPFVLARQCRPTANGDSSVSRWTFDYGNAPGIWVKLVDGSIVHFQNTATGVLVSAWLYRVFGNTNGPQTQVTLEQAIVSATIVNLWVKDVEELFVEALNSL